MDCKQFLDYLDSELFDAPSPLVQAHLAECGACRQAAASKQEALAILSELPEPPVPEGFAERILEGIPRAEPGPGGDRSRIWALAVAAALVLGIVIGVSVQWAGKLPAGSYQVSNGTITVPSDAITRVRIALDSARAIQHVVFTVNLPADMQLRGHPGARQVAWQGVLVQGRNVLNLELVAKPGAKGTLRTDLQYGGRTSSYSVQVAAVGKSSLRDVIHHLLAQLRLA